MIMKYKTAFPNFSEALNGGLEQTGVYMFTGYPGSFQTGFILTLLKDIAFLNKNIEETCVEVLLFESTINQIHDQLEHYVTKIEKSPKFDILLVDYVDKIKSNKWVFEYFQLYSEKMIGVRSFLEFIESHCLHKNTKILVLDTCFNWPKDNSDFISILSKWCKSKNLLLLVPFYFSRLDKITKEEFVNNNKEVSGIIFQEKNMKENNTTLTLDIYNKENTTWSKINFDCDIIQKYILINET